MAGNSFVALKFFGYNERRVILEDIYKEIEILTALRGVHGIVDFHGAV